MTEQRPRFAYLDGVRGLAALYVLLGHAYVSLRPRIDAELSPAALRLLKFVDAGHFAVAVFIVLSGYCLMLPVARTVDGRMRDGWPAYIKRRARRIMPPYYAALLLALVLLAILAIAHPDDLTWPSVLSHLLLVHNLPPSTILTINGPLWSVALEWQIYFSLPFIVLPITRRWGIAAALVACVTLGLAPHFLLPPGYNFDWTYPWYLGMFAMGATAAVLNVSPSSAAAALRHRIPWGMFTAALVGATIYLLLLNLRWAWDHLWLTDSLLGLTTACAIVWLTYSVTQAADRRHQPAQVLVDLLGSRWIRALGLFSYSMYLIHEPLLRVASSFLVTTPLPAVGLLLVQYLLVAPLVIGLCYLFYLVFERPFVSASASARTLAAAPVPGEPLDQAGQSAADAAPIRVGS